MYQNIFHSKKEGIIYIWDDQKGKIVIPESQATYAFRRKAGGRYKSLYGDELEKITKFSPRDPSLFESDVPITTKVLIDAYEDSDEPSTGHRTVFLDIEVNIEDGFPNVDEGDKEITAIALYDDVTSKYLALILDKDRGITDSINDNVEIRSFDNEESLISAFLTKIEEIQPTIITGWNVSKFDMPYLHNRIVRVKGKAEIQRLSPINCVYINKFSSELIIAGVSVLDYMELYKKFIQRNEPSYALAAVGKRVVGMDKITYVGSLHDLYKNDINKYIEYNLNDVKIVVAIDKKLKFIDLARNICHTGHVPYDCFGKSSRYIEGAMLIYLRRNGLVAPNKPFVENDEFSEINVDGDSDEDGFEGAYVKDPIPGRYDWVFDLDLTSMYPNIMISLNISPETVISKVEDWNVEKYLKGELKEVNISGTKYGFDDFKDFLSKNKLSIASNGVMYNTEKPGLIPSILIKWFDERKNLRKLAKNHADKKEWDKYEFFDGRQRVQKILLNSAYGVLGLPVFRFYNKDNATAVTLTGQDIIKYTDKCVNIFYKNTLGKRYKITNENGVVEYKYEYQLQLKSEKQVSVEEVEHEDHVIYVDTDSCFASATPIIEKTIPDIDKNDEQQMTKAILKVTSEVQNFVNEFYNIMAKRFFNIDKHRFDAKQEVISKSSFWLAKKRYCQLIINKGGIECDELEVKGIDVVRTSFPIKFRKFMNEFLINILKKADVKQIDDSIINFIEELKNVPVIDLAKNTSVKFSSQDKIRNYNPKARKPFQTVKGTPAQVKSALMYNDLIDYWKLNKHIPPIFDGQKIKYLYMRDNEYGIDALAMKADGTDPKEILEFIEKYVDKMRMYDQELKTKLISFYEILKWDYPSLESRKSEQFFSF